PVRSPELVLRGSLLCLVALFCTTPLRAQGAPCRQPHYRLAQQVDTSVSPPAPAPEQVSVTAILATWTPPLLGPRDACAPRDGRELHTVRVLGSLSRVDKVKDDGDWHIELTDQADSPADSCIVA